MLLLSGWEYWAVTANGCTATLDTDIYMLNYSQDTNTTRKGHLFVKNNSMVAWATQIAVNGNDFKWKTFYVNMFSEFHWSFSVGYIM